MSRRCRTMDADRESVDASDWRLAFLHPKGLQKCSPEYSRVVRLAQIRIIAIETAVRETAVRLKTQPRAQQG